MRRADADGSVPTRPGTVLGLLDGAGSPPQVRGQSALLQCRAVASHTSNILPGPGPQFHRAETTRQAIYAETRRRPSFQTAFGNSGRSLPPTMRAAKRNGPSVQRGHRLNVIAAPDRFRRLRTVILCRRRPQSLCKIAHRYGRPAACRRSRAGQGVSVSPHCSGDAVGSCRAPRPCIQLRGRFGSLPRRAPISGLPNAARRPQQSDAAIDACGCVRRAAVWRAVAMHSSARSWGPRARCASTRIGGLPTRLCIRCGGPISLGDIE